MDSRNLTHDSAAEEDELHPDSFRGGSSSLAGRVLRSAGEPAPILGRRFERQKRRRAAQPRGRRVA